MHSFKLTNEQYKKLANAHANKATVTLRLSRSMINPRGTPIKLTNVQLRRLDYGNYHKIAIKSSKLGGILPILPLLGGAAAITGIITSIVNAVKGFQTNSAQAAAARATEEYAKRQSLNN